MADTPNTAPAQSKEGLSFAQRVRGFLDGIVTDGLNRQYKEGAEKLNAKLNEQREKALKQQQETEEQQAKEAGKVSAEPLIIAPNPIMIYAANRREEELKRTAGMSGTETNTTSEAGAAPTPVTSAPAPAAVDVSKMSEKARKAYTETQSAVVEKVAINLKKSSKPGEDNGLQEILDFAGVEADLPKTNEEYRRIAKELVEKRKFTIMGKDGVEKTVSISDLDTKLEEFKTNNPDGYKVYTEKLGAESFSQKIPSNRIAKAVSESVEENTGIGSTIMTFLFALVQWIGGGFQDNLFSIMANLSADKIAKSTDEKLRAIHEDPKVIKEVSEGVRTTVLKESGYPDPKAPKPEKLEDIPAPQAPTTEAPKVTAPTEAPKVTKPTEAPKVTAPTEVPKVTKPTEAPKVTAPTEAPKVTKPTEAPKVTKPTEAPKVTAPTIVAKDAELEKTVTDLLRKAKLPIKPETIEKVAKVTTILIKENRDVLNNPQKLVEEVAAGLLYPSAKTGEAGKEIAADIRVAAKGAPSDNFILTKLKRELEAQITPNINKIQTAHNNDRVAEEAAKPLTPTGQKFGNLVDPSQESVKLSYASVPKDVSSFAPKGTGIASSSNALS